MSNKIIWGGWSPFLWSLMSSISEVHCPPFWDVMFSILGSVFFSLVLMSSYLSSKSLWGSDVLLFLLSKSLIPTPSFWGSDEVWYPLFRGRKASFMEVWGSNILLFEVWIWSFQGLIFAVEQPDCWGPDSLILVFFGVHVQRAHVCLYLYILNILVFRLCSDENLWTSALDFTAQQSF